jgi:hypothetical protein
VRISLNPKTVQELQASELVSRFVLGGAITVAAGLIASRYGPTVGGLFLAFPSILPASLTLVAKHQERRKAERGLHGVVRGRQAASLDALGALIGTAGLVGFAVSTEIAATRLSPVLTLIVATTVWLGIATGLWRLRRVW